MTQATRQTHLRRINKIRHARQGVTLQVMPADESALYFAAVHEMETTRGFYLKSIRQAVHFAAYLKFIAANPIEA